VPVVSTESERQQDVVARALRALGRSTGWSDLRPIILGASGSSVHRLVVVEGDAVLKITTHRGETPPHARVEATFYRELAGRLRIRTPDLLGSAETSDLSVLLLSAAEPTLPAASWTVDDWLRVAGELGTLHGAVPVDELATLDWLPGEAGDEDLSAAPRLRSWWAETSVYSFALPLLDRLPELRAIVQRVPRCLVHGDCHVDNLLVTDDGGFVWIDWQGVRTGRGVEDLALLWQRAEFAGGTPPRAEMLAGYARSRDLHLDSTVSAALAAHELELLLTAWPEHLHQGTAAGRDALLGRLPELADAARLSMR